MLWYLGLVLSWNAEALVPRVQPTPGHHQNQQQEKMAAGSVLRRDFVSFASTKRGLDSTALKAVWSDSRAIQDYQNLLDGRVPERAEDGPAVVIGDDPLGVGLANLAPGDPDPVIPMAGVSTATLEAALASRPQPCPIYVSCARPELVEAAIQATPELRRDDLCFINYGHMLEPVLKRYGCCRDYTTQAVCYLAINEFGKLEDDRTSIGDDMMGMPKYAAETCVTGKWAGAFADRLIRNKFHCTECFYRDFRRNMLERLMYEATYNLISIVHKRVPISEVPQFFREECDDMVYEFFQLLRGNLAVALTSGSEDRMAAYAAAQFRSKQDNKGPYLSATSPFQNLFFYDISLDMKSKGFPDPCPMHTEYWEFARDNGLLDP